MIKLEKGKFNAILGAMAGSEGKGKVACRIVYDNLGIDNLYNYQHLKKSELVLTCNHMPNAGHTFVDKEKNIKYIAKQLPTPAIFNNKEYGLDIPVVLGSGSAIRIETLEKEIEECNLQPGKNLFIHPNAGIVTDEHLEKEGSCLDNVSSTKKGGGACIAAKVMRQPGKNEKFAIARDLIPKYLKSCVLDTSEYLNLSMKDGKAVFFEGAQGFDLDINHGLDYPFTTSRMSNISAYMAESGISPIYVGSIIGVLRPYPIRVGNVYDEDKNVIGYSGDYASDNKELDWVKISELSGAPNNLDLTELTTVTGKVRRVFTFSRERFIKFCMVNSPNELVISFVDYIDYNMHGLKNYNWNDLSDASKFKINKFICNNMVLNNSLKLFSCGPDNSHVIHK